MAFALDDLVARIRLDTTDLEAAVGRASTVGSAIGSGFGSAVGSITGGAFSSALTAVRGFTTGSVEAFAAVEDATGAASVQFGQALPTVLAFADQASASFGLSEKAALEAQNTFGTLGKAAGLSGEPLATFAGNLTGLAGDLASFKGTSTEQAIEAVGAALRGETEPIRAYGVLLDDATLRNRALTLGLIDNVKTALTPQQKALAAQAEILAQTSDAQGDYARTSDSTANTQKTLAANIENAQAALGEKLAPAVTAVRQGFLTLVQGASGVIDFIGAVTAAVQPIVAAFASGLQPAIAAVVPALQGFVAAIPTPVLQGLATVVGLVAGALLAQAAATGVVSVATGIGSAAKALFTTTTNLETGAVTRGTAARLAHNVSLIAGTAATVASTVARAASTAATTLWTGVTIAATAASNAARTAVLLLNAAFLANPFVAVAAVLALLVAGVVIAYRQSETFRNIVNGAFEAVKTVVLGVLNTLRTAITGAFDAIKTYFTAVFTAYRTLFTTAFDAIRTVVTTVINGVVGFVSGFPGRAASALSSLGGAITGVASGALNAFSGAVRGGADGVVGFFGGVPSRIVGGLGNLGGLLVSAGRDLLAGLARGIGDAVGAVVAKAREAAARVVNGVKSALGINSPSKVMAEQVGKPMAQGIAVGLERSTGLVENALGRLTELPDLSTVGRLTGNLSRNTAGGGGRPASVFNLTVNASPGTERDTAQLTIAALKRMELLTP